MTLLSIENSRFFSEENNIYLTCDDLLIENNGCYALKASNGSGKTTFFNCLMKKPKYSFEGNVTIKHSDLSKLTTEDMFKLSIAYLQQTTVELPNITYKNLILTIISLNEIKKFGRDEITNIIHMKRLASEINVPYDLLNKEIGSCSSGERKILDLFIFSMFDLDMFFIDEFDANLDENNKEILINYIIKNRHRKVFFIISHDMEFLKKCKCKVFFTIKRNKITKL